jgi:hypothetical protein
LDTAPRRQARFCQFAYRLSQIAIGLIAIGLIAIGLIAIGLIFAQAANSTGHAPAAPNLG